MIRVTPDLTKQVLGNYQGPHRAWTETDRHGYTTLIVNLPASQQGYFVPATKQLLVGEPIDVKVTYTYVPVSLT